MRRSRFEFLGLSDNPRSVCIAPRSSCCPTRLIDRSFTQVIPSLPRQSLGRQVFRPHCPPRPGYQRCERTNHLAPHQSEGYDVSKRLYMWLARFADTGFQARTTSRNHYAKRTPSLRKPTRTRIASSCRFRSYTTNSSERPCWVKYRTQPRTPLNRISGPMLGLTTECTHMETTTQTCPLSTKTKESHTVDLGANKTQLIGWVAYIHCKKG